MLEVDEELAVNNVLRPDPKRAPVRVINELQDALQSASVALADTQSDYAKAVAKARSLKKTVGQQQKAMNQAVCDLVAGLRGEYTPSLPFEADEGESDAGV